MLLHECIAYTNDSLPVDSTLHDAIFHMDREGESHVVYLDGDEIRGILTLKNSIELYRQGANPQTRGIDFASFPVICIHNDRPIDMAVEMMIDYGVRRIVLVDDRGLYRGTLTYGDILRYYETSRPTHTKVAQSLQYRNRATTVESYATIEHAVQRMYDEGRDVVVIRNGNEYVGIVTEKNILQLMHNNISFQEPIAGYMTSKIIFISSDHSVEEAISIMREHTIHHILVQSDDIYALSEKDLILSYNTPLEVRLEGKLRDAKATYNLLGLAFCEIIDLGDKQIIKWLNAEAMMTFHVKIDDSVAKMVGEENWNRLMDSFRLYRGIEREKIEIAGRIYELTLMEAEVNQQPFMKLFLNDISDLVRLNEKLSQSLQRTLTLEKEKSKLYLDVAAVMCLALDTTGRVILLNPKGCSVLETTQEEAIGQDWFEMFVLGGERKRAKTLFDAIIAEELPMVEYYENKVRTKRGNERLVAWHNALMRDDDGNIIGTFSSGEDITLMHEKQETINRMAHYDALTNLPNRLLLNARLDHSLERAQRARSKVIVLYVDIDNFKDINETYGYSVGDSVIQMVALKMGVLIRSEDTISRIGGDEFVILLEEINDVNECERTLKAVVDLFREPLETSSGDLQLSVSIGIAVYPEDGEESETLLKHADIALRLAKESGDGDYRFYTHEMSVQLLERVLMERELRRSVEEKEFVVYYQPQIDLSSGKLIGAEALVRWKHPVLGIVRPDIFIPLAEATNLIVAIGEEVLIQACREVKQWSDVGLFEGRISVNVSGKQFERADVVEVIERLVQESELPLDRLELEITESVLMSNPNLLGEKLKRLRGLGIEIAIDDFGTGYSSLSYLKTFPIDKLKIDQSFVRGVCNDPQDRVIIKAIIAMADALNFKTIAEGIEQIEQGNMLSDLGCQQAQGYYYARPLDKQAFEHYLRQHQERFCYN